MVRITHTQPLFDDFKTESSIIRIQSFDIFFSTQRTDNSNSYIESLLRSKYVCVVKVVLLHRWEYVDALFAFENVHFVRSEGHHDDEKQKGAESAHLWWQMAPILLQTQTKWLAKLVLVQ